MDSRTALALPPVLVLFAAGAAAQCEQGQLVPALIDPGDTYAGAVGVVGDLLLVGARGDDDKGTNAGAVHLFTCPGISCTELPANKVLAVDGEALDSFGETIAVSGDVAAVAAPGKEVIADETTVTAAGQIYLFQGGGGALGAGSQVHLPEPRFGDRLGKALALSNGFLIASTPTRSVGGIPTGAVHSFLRSGASASFEQTVVSSDLAPNNFGTSVAVSDDLLAVGAPSDSDAAGGAGAVYLFERGGLSWTETQKLTASDAAGGDRLGSSVAISGDQVLVGARVEGAVYVFEKQGGAYIEVQKLTPSTSAFGGDFGNAMAIDGDRLLVGARNLQTPVFIGAGAAVVFERTNGVWAEAATLFASDGKGGDELGAAVSLQGDRLLAGAPGHDVAGVGTVGKAYAYSSSGASCFDLYGDPCPCGAGEEPALEMFGSPKPGGEINMRLTGAPANAPGLLLFGNPTSIPLPNGCQQLVLPLLPASGFTTSFAGTLAIDFTLDEAATPGVSVSVQAAVIDIAAPGLFCASNGATVVVI